MAQQGDDAWGGPLSFLKIPAPYSQRPRQYTSRQRLVRWETGMWREFR
jgi:hypothetical protein